jgi:hypothetical protein
MKWACLLVFIVGRAYLYISDRNAHAALWDQIYYLWSKSVVMLLFFTISLYIPDRKFKRSFFLMGIFCVITLWWQILATFNYHIASEKQIMSVIYAAFTLTTVGVLVWKNN